MVKLPTGRTDMPFIAKLLDEALRAEGISSHSCLSA
jgi:hypothetical protein